MGADEQPEDRSAAQGQLGPDFHQRDEDNIDASREPAAAQGRFEATISPGIEYGTERPCEIGRITYTEGVHRYVALTFRYTDDDDAWRLTWVGWDETHDAVQLPEGIYPSAAMLAALAVAPVKVEGIGYAAA